MAAREGSGQDPATLLARVARGDHAAFEAVYDQFAGPVYGLVRKVLRDPAQSEEVAQEVLLEVWRTASRFDPARGSASAWVMTIAHRRAVDRVRSENAAAVREQKLVPGSGGAATTSRSWWRPHWTGSVSSTAWTPSAAAG